MSEKVEVTVYTYDELSPQAQEKARKWWLKDDLYYEWWDTIFEDFLQVCEILGIEIARGPRGNKPRIYFSGFWNQGDGASFEGSYSYKPGCMERIKEHAPADKKLHEIARKLTRLQKKYFYKLEATISAGHRGVHSGTMRVSVQHRDDGARDPNYEDEQVFLELMRDLADWLYWQLEEEYGYLTSDEGVAETIRVNEYRFLEDGSPAPFLPPLPEE